jgi:pyrroloquinoline quinone (PQQ) biosynthesis protein C
LIVDPRGGPDHMTLMSREAVALGVTPQQLATSQPTPLVKAALMAFDDNASTRPSSTAPYGDRHADDDDLGKCR